MQTPAILPEACYRTRQHVSLRLDAHISELELAVMEHHIERCASCRAFAEDLETVTETLRSSELVEPPIRFEVPRRPARFGVSRAGAVAAAAAVVAVGLAGVFGLGPDSGTGRGLESGTLQQPSLTEHLSLVREGATPQPPSPPRGIEAAESTTVVRNANAAPDGAAQTFGEIPPAELPGDNG